MRAGKFTAILITALILLPAYAAARQGSPGGQGGPREGSRGLSSETIKELGLSDSTASALRAELEALRQERMGIMKEFRENMDALSKELGYSSPSEDRLRSILESIDSAEKKRQALRLRETEILKKHLSVKQRARYLMLRMENFKQSRGHSRPLKGYEGGTGGQGMQKGDGQRMPMGGQRPPR